MATYWNTRLGRFIYINGSLLNQSEPVLFEVSEVKLLELSKVAFGIDNTKFPKRIGPGWNS